MNPTQMPLSAIAGTCQRESAKFQRGEPSDDTYCFELLRRAICERDDTAWEAVVAQYRGMVIAWTKRRSLPVALRQEDDYWVNRTFERFWSAVKPEQFGQFETLAALMKYLQMCAFSVLADAVRRHDGAHTEPLDTAGLSAEADETAGNAEESVIGDLAGKELWDTVASTLTGEDEHTVAYLSLVLDLKPREIQARYPHLFPMVADVHRIKRNVLERLRRNPEIRRWLG